MWRVSVGYELEGELEGECGRLSFHNIFSVCLC